MTPRFKVALSILLALAVGVLLVWLLREDGQGADGVDLKADGDFTDEEAARLSADGSDPDAAGGGNAQLGAGARGTDGSLVGARTPSGIDYSDPAVRKSELMRILGTKPVNWREAAKIAAIMEEPIPDGLRPVILWELRSGKRLQVMHLFAKLRDASFVDDLFELIDDPEASPGAQRSALTALWQMPGAPPDAVALQLESRLQNDLKNDGPLLFAIAARGGPEAARALVEYVQRSPNPENVPLTALRQLDVIQSPEAAEIVSDAIRNAEDPKELRAYLQIAAKPGARTMVEPLKALDRDGVSKEVREQALQALSQIGDEASVEYLLKKAAEPGVFGASALRSISGMGSADPAARPLLKKALEEADQSARPEKTKESLLLAIGRVGDKSALPLVAARLDDGNDDVRVAAVRAMGRMGDAAQRYTPKLVRLYEQGDAKTRMRVAICLGEIGGKDAILDMQRLLKEKDLSPSLARTLRMGLKNAQSKEAGQRTR